MAEYRYSCEVLRELIGLRVHHQGRDCTIIEVLDDEPAVVLQCDTDLEVIQPDQFGDPARRVRATFTVAIFTSNGQSLNPVFVELGMPDPRR